MRFFFPAFFFALGTAAAVFACSSSDDTKAQASCDGGCGDAASDASSANEIVDAGPTSFSGGGGDGGTMGNGFDAGTLVVGSDAGALCLSNGITETEDNSVLQSADQIPGQSGTFCGRLDSFADIDFVKFNLPQNAQSLHIDILASGGGLAIYATADGNPFPFPSEAAGDFVFAPGKDYVFRFGPSRTGKPIDYRMELTIE